MRHGDSVLSYLAPRLFRTEIDSTPLLVSYSVLKDDYHSSVSHFLQLQCTGNVLLLDPYDHCTGTYRRQSVGS